MSLVSPDAPSRQLSAGEAEEEHFARVFATYRRELRRMVAARLDQQLQPRLDASDIVQETQLEAYRRMKDSRGPQTEALGMWLRGIALERVYNAYRDHVRAARRSVKRELPLPDRSSVALGYSLVSKDAPVWRQLTAFEVAGRVRAAIERLKFEDQEILLLRIFEGVTNAQAADRLGVASEAASKRYGRSLLRLRALLLEEEDASSFACHSFH